MLQGTAKYRYDKNKFYLAQVSLMPDWVVVVVADRVVVVAAL